MENKNLLISNIANMECSVKKWCKMQSIYSAGFGTVLNKNVIPTLMRHWNEQSLSISTCIQYLVKLFYSTLNLQHYY